MASGTLGAMTAAELEKMMKDMKDMTVARPLWDIGRMPSRFSDHVSDAFGYGGGGSVNMPPPKPKPSLISMIASRMRWGEGEASGFDHIQPHQLTEEQIAVFVIQNKRALIIYDDANLFPSDTLITQLRLLEKN
jgi:hypothetical protein